MTKSINKKRGSAFRARARNRLLFYVSLVFLPVLQYLTIYIYANIESVLLAFQEYEIGADFRYKITFTLDNFTYVFKLFEGKEYMIWNSLVAWIVGLSEIPVTLMFAFYCFKKYPAHSFFRVILFAPSIISSMVVCLLFKYTVNNMFPAIVGLFGGKMEGLLVETAAPTTQFTTVLLFGLFHAFGTSMVLYLSSMTNISDSIIEAAQIDGANLVQEFFLIILPFMYSTLTTLFVVGLTGIFTNQLSLYSMFGEVANEQIQTTGYYIFRQTMNASYISTSYMNYSQLSALGLIITAITFPLCTFLRKFFERHDPTLV